MRMSRDTQDENGHSISRFVRTELDQVKLALNHTMLHPLRIAVRNRESPEGHLVGNVKK